MVPLEKKVAGSNVILANALQGYALAEFPEGVESAATYQFLRFKTNVPFGLVRLFSRFRC